MKATRTAPQPPSFDRRTLIAAAGGLLQQMIIGRDVLQRVLLFITIGIAKV